VTSPVRTYAAARVSLRSDASHRHLVAVALGRAIDGPEALDDHLNLSAVFDLNQTGRELHGGPGAVGVAIGDHVAVRADVVGLGVTVTDPAAALDCPSVVSDRL